MEAFTRPERLYSLTFNIRERFTLILYGHTLTRLMIEEDRKLTTAPLAAAIQFIPSNHKPNVY